jgi:hypothetical protein
MKKTRKLCCYLTIFALLSLSLIGCSTKSVENVVKAKNTLNFGTFKDNNYTQSFFGMSLTTPKDWSVMDDDTRNSLYNKSIDITAKDEESKKKMDLSKEKTLFMFIVSQNPYSPKGIGSNIIFETENLGLTGNLLVKDGKDYIECSKSSMKETSSIKYTFGDTKKEKIGNKDFYVADVSFDLQNGTSTKQKMYCTVQKGYALSFILTCSGNEKADAELNSIMNTIKFK